MFFSSIRFRLTLWYSLTLAVLLAASGVFWHGYLSRSLLRQMDEKLLAVAQDVRYFHREVAPPAGDEHCPGLEGFVLRHDGTEFVQILDETGKIACTSSNMDSFRLPLSPAAQLHVRHGATYFETVSGLLPSPLRLLSFPVIEDSHLVDIIQVGESQAVMAHTLGDLRQTFLVFSPLALLILIVGGWYLAGQALAPMARMARAARQVTAENLSQRLPVEHPGDEIAMLAENVNAMLARLEESFRRIRQFSGDASHELRTPLAILRGETEVTLRWARDPEEYRRTLESNLEEISRMGRIIEDLLTLAKSDAGELPLEIRELSLSDLLQELYLQGNTLGESRSIAVKLRLEVTEEIRIRGDELRLRQMFLNLIANGIKYTPPGGEVEICLAVRQEEAVVSVHDTGIGIPPEHLPHIFDRFYRIDKARNRADGGTGLGLAISKGMVEAHAGRITVASTPGKGSTFTVFLPLQGPERPIRPA
ncbi:MAG: heavy metal sensor histidine kinase [Desulfuromonadales bacterium]|nr:heavy metal sensor histidine kinase [Desulfuromonadales bacterium]